MNRREEIIAIAAKVFHEKGFYSACLQDVAGELGINKGSLYYYFDSKEHLLLEIISSPMNTIMAKLRDIFSSPANSREKLKLAIKEHMLMYDSHFHEVCVFFDILSHPPESIKEKLADMMREQYRLMVAIIRQGREKGEFKDSIDLQMTSFAILGMCTWAYQWVRKSGRLSMEQMAGLFGEIVLEGVTP